MREIRLLLVEDDEDDYIITRDLLDDIAGGAYRLDWAADLQSARELLSLNEHDVCLMDYALGPSDGVSLLKEAQTLGFNRPIIMLTGQDDDSLLVADFRSEKRVVDGELAVCDYVLSTAENQEN